MRNLDEIKEIISSRKIELEREFGVSAIAVFGSYARNEQRADSDIDILIDFKRSIGLLRFIELERRLSQILGARVELITRKSLKPFIGKRILKEAVPV